MSRKVSAKAGGVMLIVASSLGVIAMTVFSRSSGVRPQPSSGAATITNAATTGPVAVTPAAPGGSATRDSLGMFVLPSSEPAIERIESPFSAASTDSVAAVCVAMVRADSSQRLADSSSVVVGERYGVHPVPGRGRDSLIVEGTARGRDETRAVWHCASTTTVEERHGVTRVVIEDGWPGVPARFQSAHPITTTAHALCDKRTESLFPETDLRNVKRWRVADTLHVTGTTMPLDPGELSHDFHCRAVVRQGAIVSVVMEASRE